MNTRTNTGFNGITQRTRGRRTFYEIWFIAKPGNKFHIGSANTLPEAVRQRTEYITNLI